VRLTAAVAFTLSAVAPARADDAPIAVTLAEVLAAAPEAPIFAAVKLAACKALPELAIRLRVNIVGVTKHAMVLAADFLERIAERREEIFVGVKNGALKVEFDYRLYTI